MTAVGKAYPWKGKLEKAGLSIKHRAQREGVCEAQARKLLPLINLLLMILKRALTGGSPHHRQVCHSRSTMAGCPILVAQASSVAQCQWSKRPKTPISGKPA